MSDQTPKATAQCSCPQCPSCRGTGSYWVDLRGRVVTFNDGLCDLETCNECGGSGIEVECDYCHDARERDDEALDAATGQG